VKRTALRSKPRAEDDKVTPEVYEHVMRRDGGCMAPVLDRHVDQCRDQWGSPSSQHDPRALTLQHIWLDYSVKAKRAPSKPENLLVLCYGHHEGTGPTHGAVWATSEENLDRQRAYLKDLIAKGKA
jgi:hypothetical protein